MDEQDYEDKFEELTEGMALEKLYDQIANRADIARFVIRQTASVYRMARRAGLPRRLSAELARSYWSTEMSPINTYVIGEEL
ncbi:hypothetical protein [Streptomyces althioticus]|uniref:hypothetical protein n=1 Tax=Streptomyces althioticus TaxID=83380 RepID=UPI0033C67890